MRILVAGGDGFCGWPTSLHLSKAGYEVKIVDNLSRRHFDRVFADSLTPIQSIEARLVAWREVSGREITFTKLDLVTQYSELVALLRDFQPEAVIHFAEQCSAPFSMHSSGNKRFTVEQNLVATHNLLAALEESDIETSLVHLGSVGVYGYTNHRSAIPEGYLDTASCGADSGPGRKILYPSDPGSIYHLTKALDQHLFLFYAKHAGIRITDLHQGVVWGTQTENTNSDPRLVNRFSYDTYFGTVVNRFILQAALGQALTVYGSGMQARAFIFMHDVVRCIELVISSPPPAGHVMPRIFNQVTETRRVIEVAELISGVTGSEISFLPNLRAEEDAMKFSVENHGLRHMGAHLEKFSKSLLLEEIRFATQYVSRADQRKLHGTHSGFVDTTNIQT